MRQRQIFLAAKRALLVGLAVWLSGFGILWIWWIKSPHNASLPGLFSYPSAVWGDGLFLPLLAASLTYAIHKLPSPKKQGPAAIGVLLGLIAGGLVILGWLSDPSPAPNWTMPAAHQLNHAGRIHAAFLLGACGLFGALWAELLYRLRQIFGTPSTRMIGVAIVRSVPFTLALASSLGYAFLAGYDSAAVRSTGAGTTSLLALGASVLGLAILLIWMARTDVRSLAATSASAFALAAAGVVLVLLPPSTVVVALLTVTAIAAGFSFVMEAEPLRGAAGAHPLADQTTRGPSGLEWAAVPALFSIVPLVTDRMGVTYEQTVKSAFLLLCVFSLSLFLRYIRHRRWEPKTDAPALIMAALFLTSVSILLKIPDIFNSEIAAISIPTLVSLVSFIAYEKCQNDYKVLQKIEALPQRITNENTPTSIEGAHERRIWSVILGNALVALTLIVTSVIMLTPEVKWNQGTSALQVPPVSIIFVGAGLLILGLTTPQILSIKRRNPENTEKTPPAFRKISIYAIVGASLLLIAGGLLPILRETSLSSLTVFQAALIAIFSIECILGNGLRLNLARPTRITALLGILSGSATFSLACWALSAGVETLTNPADVGRSFIFNIGAILLVGLLTVAATATAYGYGGVPYLTQYTPVSNATQDSILLALMWLGFAWLPQVALTLFETSDLKNFSSTAWITSILILWVFLIFSTVMLWILKNNDTHSGQERKKRELHVPDYARDDASLLKRTSALPGRVSDYLRPKATKKARDEAHLDAIDGHTAVQNVIALALLFATLAGIVPWVFEFLKECVSPNV